ncbi:MAG TPA: acetolactate synthase small subunit [Acidimicrobiales bacterium]|jgi:acetolactate synthase-1/3 small subunit|nr:acetolactate synthase small subunit [Acidimicrobiales bacterium]
MSKATLRTFIAYVEDLPGVLNRVTSLFRRRNYNIVSLTVGRTERPGVSRMTVVLEADEDAARRIEANLYKLVNVLFVEDTSHAATMARELALLKVRTDATSRGEVMRLCDVFRARVVDIGPEALVAEITGTEDKIDGLVDVLRPFGIVEMVRTGVVAMVRSAEVTDTDRILTSSSPPPPPSPSSPPPPPSPRDVKAA